MVALLHTDFEIIYFQKRLISSYSHSCLVKTGEGAVCLHDVQDMGEVQNCTVMRH